MQIIVVDPRLKRARTIDVRPRMLVLFRAANELRIPMVRDLVALIMRDDVERQQQFLRDNISAMARKLGEMQAQLMRLDALGERVSKAAGIRPEEFNFTELPGRGGALSESSRPMTLPELQSELQRVAKDVDSRDDFMNVIESEQLSTRVRNSLLPQNAPVTEGFIGSGYGMRTDPFTGQLAMHAGVDFAANVGTPIFAAAGGVVIAAEQHPAYGNAVSIDHGNGLVTMYAHASKIVVKVGEIVKRGQKIAEVGTTGRSTGPHLHFEVHVNDVPQNPWKFLAQQKPGSPLADLVGRGASEARRRQDMKPAFSATAIPADSVANPESATPIAPPAIAPAGATEKAPAAAVLLPPADPSHAAAAHEVVPPRAIEPGAGGQDDPGLASGDSGSR